MLYQRSKESVFAVSTKQSKCLRDANVLLSLRELAEAWQQAAAGTA